MINHKKFKSISAKQLIDVRFKLRLTQKSLAKKIGVSPSCVNKRETDGIFNIVDYYNFCSRLNIDFNSSLNQLIELSKEQSESELELELESEPKSEKEKVE